MSDVMAIESITEEYAKFLWYFTEARVPYKLSTGWISDIDVLGYNPKTKKALAVECKAWGWPSDYPNFTDKDVQSYVDESIPKLKTFKSSPTNKRWIKWFDEFRYIVPWSCSHQEELEQRLSKKYKMKITILPIHDLLLNIMSEVKKDMHLRRRRYSNTALEFCRRLIRAYDNGQMDLLDIDTKLSKKANYQRVKENYISSCLRIVKQNADTNGKGVNTRMNTLAMLMKTWRSSIKDLATKATKLWFKDLNYSRIDVALGTRLDLWIVICHDDNTYWINERFEKEIAKLIW